MHDALDLLFDLVGQHFRPDQQVFRLARRFGLQVQAGEVDPGSMMGSRIVHGPLSGSCLSKQSSCLKAPGRKEEP
jgi:hypothetical protein